MDIISVVASTGYQCQIHNEEEKTYSGVSRLKNSRSIAAENAANANPPPNAAFGPEFRANTPPATKPEATEFTRSFLARYCRMRKSAVSATLVYNAALTDSITHSIPANNAPTLPNPLPLVHIPLPISLNISFAFCPVFKPACVCCRSIGSSYANDADIKEKNAPMPKPIHIILKGPRLNT